MAPKPSSPFSRSTTQATQASMARLRSRLGHRPSVTFSTPSSALKPMVQASLGSGTLETRSALTVGLNSSRTRTPRGLRAWGRRFISTSSGTITVRAQ